ncbi:MAG: RluA family pseudouridine synthase [Pseudomonadota bacterium]
MTNLCTSTAETLLAEPGDDRVIGIIAETASFLVVDKPAGLLSVPGKNEPDCLEARLQAVYPDALTVHRLDMATSGICVIARGKPSLAHLQQQFERRLTKKTYEAVVWGQMTDDADTVDAPIRCDWPNRPLQMIDHQEGRQAITHWRVIDRQADRTRLELTPVTGRSHQLRLHMKSLGHPILGDQWYAEGEAKEMSPRLLLHARELGFAAPDTGRRLSFRSDCPF